MKRSRFGIVGMTYQSSLMMHLLALYIPRLHVMEGRPDAWCFSICSLGVMMLTHHATTKAQSHRKSHASHHSGMFIFKNDSEQSHHLHPPPSSSIDHSRRNEKKEKKTYLTDWRCCGSLPQTAGDRRSICVLTQITINLHSSLESGTNRLPSLQLCR